MDPLENEKNDIGNDLGAVSSLRSQLETLRTYEGDVAEAVQHQKTSVIKVAVAEQKRKIERGEVEEVRKELGLNAKMVFGSILFVILGVGVGWFAYVWSKKPATVPVTVLPGNPIISSDFQQEIPVDGLNRNDILQKIGEEKGKSPTGTIESIYFTKESTAGKKILTAAEFLTLIGVTPPGILARSLNDSFMFGTESIKGGTYFLILTSSSFENAYPAMLQWEPTLFANIQNLFALPSPSSTSNVSVQGPYADVVIKNKDTRVLLDENGNSLLIYSLPDKEHIVITTEADTAAEIFTRLTTLSKVSQ